MKKFKRLRDLDIDKSVLPGLRIIKTIIALFIVMLISIGSNGLLSPYDMAVVAILAMQDSVAKSFTEVRNRLGATIIGGLIGIVGMAMGLVLGADILKLILVPFGVFVIVYLCSKIISRTEFIIIACYVFLAITLDKSPEISWIYPFKVMGATIISSVVSMIVNLYDPRKKQRVNLYKERTK